MPDRSRARSPAVSVSVASSSSASRAQTRSRSRSRSRSRPPTSSTPPLRSRSCSRSRRGRSPSSTTSRSTRTPPQRRPRGASRQLLTASTSFASKARRWMELHTEGSEGGRFPLLAQRIRCPLFDFYFLHCPILGNEIQYQLILPLLTWCMVPSKSSGGEFMLRLYLTWFLSNYTANYAKECVRLERPPSPPVVRLTHAFDREFGFPSTHASSALAFSCVIALHLQSFLVGEGDGGGWWHFLFGSPLRAYATAMVYTVHVTFSRLYVGVHSLCDLVGGMVLGALSLGIVWALEVLGLLAAVLDNDYSLTSAGVGTVFVLLTLCFALYPDRRPEHTCHQQNLAVAGIFIGCYFASPFSLASTPAYITGEGATLFTAPAARGVVIFAVGAVYMLLFHAGLHAALKAAIGAKSLMLVAPGERGPAWIRCALFCAEHMLLGGAVTVAPVILDAWWKCLLEPL